MSWGGQSVFSQQEKSLDQDRLIVFHNHAVIFCVSQKVGGPRVRHSCAFLYSSRPARITRLFVSLVFHVLFLNDKRFKWLHHIIGAAIDAHINQPWVGIRLRNSFIFFVSQGYSMVKSCGPDWFYRQTKIVNENEENLEANEFEKMFYQNMVLNKNQIWNLGKASFFYMSKHIFLHKFRTKWATKSQTIFKFP